MSQRGLLMFSSSQKAQRGLTTHCQETNQRTHAHTHTHTHTGRVMSKHFPLRSSSSFIKKLTVCDSGEMCKLHFYHLLISALWKCVYSSVSFKKDRTEVVFVLFFRYKSEWQIIQSCIICKTTERAQKGVISGQVKVCEHRGTAVKVQNKSITNMTGFAPQTHLKM